MAFSKEFKVGILVTIIIFIIYVGANFLKGKDIFSTSNIYYTTYQNVKGLNKGNPITLNGLSVGRIQNIDILPKEPHKIQVTLAVDKKIRKSLFIDSLFERRVWEKAFRLRSKKKNPI